MATKKEGNEDVVAKGFVSHKNKVQSVAGGVCWRVSIGLYRLDIYQSRR